MSITVALADDQAIIRDGLTYILQQLPDIDLVGTATDGREACDLARRLQPDVFLMDLRMPGLDGLEATRLIKQDHPAIEVVVLTTFDDDESVFVALRHGARGYLLKDATAQAIGDAIRQVADGRAALDPTVQSRLLDTLGRTAPGAFPVGPGPEVLTAREAEVVALIAEGLTNQQIAARLVVSEATVKTHINHAFSKLGVRDRAQAVAWAYRTGLARP
jgi:DNA-binding NarL/FixJ family response regulator